MNKLTGRETKASLLLLLAAAIWGFAFVAQRVGMEHIGAFTYNGVRFLLGTLSLLPLVFFLKRSAPEPAAPGKKPLSAHTAGLVAGTIMFCGVSLQQLGLYSTSAGKAGFITGLYLVLVPLAGVFLGHRIYPLSWVSVALAVTGLYFICVVRGFSVESGDLLELAGSFFWTAHILVINHFSRRVDALRLSMWQCLTCSALSLAVAVFTEKITLHGLLLESVPILYGGVASVGIAYTLQIVGQKDARPSHAAIILSMESVFACIGGMLILGETMPLRSLLGCLLMISGIVCSQLAGIRRKNTRTAPAETLSVAENSGGK